MTSIKEVKKNIATGFHVCRCSGRDNGLFYVEFISDNENSQNKDVIWSLKGLFFLKTRVNVVYVFEIQVPTNLNHFKPWLFGTSLTFRVYFKYSKS